MIPPERTNLFCPKGDSWMCMSGGPHVMLVRDVEEDIRTQGTASEGNNYKCNGCGNKFYIEIY